MCYEEALKVRYSEPKAKNLEGKEILRFAAMFSVKYYFKCPLFFDINIVITKRETRCYSWHGL
jgi:hypothetical protein